MNTQTNAWGLPETGSSNQFPIKKQKCSPGPGDQNCQKFQKSIFSFKLSFCQNLNKLCVGGKVGTGPRNRLLRHPLCVICDCPGALEQGITLLSHRTGTQAKVQALQVRHGSLISEDARRMHGGVPQCGVAQCTVHHTCALRHDASVTQVSKKKCAWTHFFLTALIIWMNEKVVDW